MPQVCFFNEKTANILIVNKLVIKNTNDPRPALMVLATKILQVFLFFFLIQRKCLQKIKIKWKSPLKTESKIGFPYKFEIIYLDHFAFLKKTFHFKLKLFCPS